MSCDSIFKRVGEAAQKNGVSRLASRAAAYAGVTAGAVGGIALAAVAWQCARRSSGLRRLLDQPAPPVAGDGRQGDASYSAGRQPGVRGCSAGQARNAISPGRPVYLLEGGIAAHLADLLLE